MENKEPNPTGTLSQADLIELNKQRKKNGKNLSGNEKKKRYQR